MTMALRALGFDLNEDTVNKVMGAAPMQGAAWENALACANHFGCISTLRVPATVRQLKAWCDAKVPVMIAWNPEGREWSHASLVYNVTEGLPTTRVSAGVYEDNGPGLYIWVADPNIPHPEKTFRVVHEDTFYAKWYEKWPNYLVRRPACAVQREVTEDGRQVLASRTASRLPAWPSKMWPKNSTSIDDVAESLKHFVKYPDTFYNIYERYDPEEYDLVNVDKLVGALRRRNQQGVKQLAERLDKRFPGLIGNVIWAFALDGIEKSASSGWMDTPLSTWTDRLINGFAPARGITDRNLPVVMRRYAFELGAAGESMPDWLRYMGTVDGVNVQAAFADGTSAVPVETMSTRVASQYIQACGGSCGCGGSCDGNCACKKETACANV